MKSYTYYVISKDVSSGKWMLHKSVPTVRLIASNIQTKQEVLELAKEKAALDSEAEIIEVTGDGSLVKIYPSTDGRVS